MITRLFWEALPGNGPVDDGLEIYSVQIEVGLSISIRFHQWLLNPSAVCPACYTLSVVGEQVHRVQVGYGHPDKDGRIKYVYAGKHCGRYEPFPETPDEWSHFWTCDYTVMSPIEQIESSSEDETPLRRFVRQRNKQAET